ncbi:MAG TPA: DUF692 family protein, partial [Nannocystis exedens]|nr:DUF692 family protein [Nannocystis exedens]
MSSSRPYLGHGVGLRRRHYDRALRGDFDVDWVEAVSENFFGEGGRPLAVLERLRADMPVALHGVSLAIGSPEAPSAEYLRRLARLSRRIEPVWISDHLCWGHLDGVYSHELLPLPLTQTALDRVVSRVSAVQEALGRRILLENVSSYLSFTCDEIPEWEFLAEISRRADCLILLDLNNILVSAHNHGFDPEDYLEGMPAERVWQFHLARHSDRGAYRFDDHCGAVPAEVWRLYEEALRRYGAVSSIIEWDEGVPPWPELRAEQRQARGRARAIVGDDPGLQVATISDCMSTSRTIDVDVRSDRSLTETQGVLWRAIGTPGGSAAILKHDPELERELAAKIRSSEQLAYGARIDIYAQSMSWRLRGALAEIYPTLLWLLGDAGFDQLAALMIREASSRDPDLGRFGAGLAAVLATASWAAEDPWLVDLARCEWAMAELLDAADPPNEPLTSACLADRSVDQWPELRLQPIPALRLLASRFDLGLLWACRDRGEPALAGFAAARGAKAGDLGSLVWRRGFVVFRRSLAAA